MDIENAKIAVVGLGYVGLPLAVEFAKKFFTVGFDVNGARVDQLIEGDDETNEVTRESLVGAQQSTAHHPGVVFCSSEDMLREINVYIVTVPTPIDSHNQPDLKPLLRASETVGGVLNFGDVVIYESTVFPGLTEEVCIPVLEATSGLILNQDFFAGYSPERINPGDHQRRLPDIKKVTSGSNPEAAAFVDDLYASIITAGTYRASSIRVAEAAKVIENTQRDVNIALVNELAMIFNKAGIDTEEVLEAAGTKWNFLPFRPGLVGGHCIGVDPYYLTYKAAELGYHPEMILAGRRINDNMATYIASEVVTLMTKRRIQVVDARVLILGVTFKENCPDIRNTKVVDVISKLTALNMKVDVYDPWVGNQKFENAEFSLIEKPQAGTYDAIILAVAHSQFIAMNIDHIRKLGRQDHILYDVKSILDKTQVDGRL